MSNKLCSLVSTVFVTCILFIGLFLFVFSTTSIADNDHHEDRHYKTKTFAGSMHKVENDGNEVTGVVSALLLVVANIPVFFSLLIRMLISFMSLSDEFKNQLKRINQAQKKYLMPLHYYLNLFAILPILIHFRLSSCRSNALPEIGMIVMIIIAAAGAVLKFKFSPKIMRKGLYQVHTSPWAAGLLMMILFVGHSVVD
ncbi:hypothetical protein [Desulforegula conservatrix]|uniref:hypothetical protein n=1 Tax=Desulforegula conservatrix TaxID=153026 RepID=UPI00047F574C|nr:hypothetical protein [Desulforegula conservatrix]